jgi:hypothetical protein
VTGNRFSIDGDSVVMIPFAAIKKRIWSRLWDSNENGVENELFN